MQEESSLMFPKRLKDAMAMAGLNAAGLAEKSSVSKGYISGLLSRKKPPPSPKTLSKLADVLGCSPLWLLNGQEPKGLKQAEALHRATSAREQADENGFWEKHRETVMKIDRALWQFPYNKSKMRQVFKTQIMAHVDELDAWCEENLS